VGERLPGARLAKPGAGCERQSAMVSRRLPSPAAEGRDAEVVRPRSPEAPAPGAADPRSILRIQRLYGNRAVGQLVSGSRRLDRAVNFVNTAGGGVAVNVLANWGQLAAAVPGLAQQPPLGAALFALNATIVNTIPGVYRLVVNHPVHAWTYNELTAIGLYEQLDRLVTEASRTDTVALTGGQRQFDPSSGIGLSVTHQVRNLFDQPLANGSIWERIHKVEEQATYELSVLFAGGQLGDFHHIKHDMSVFRPGRTTIHQLWFDRVAGQEDTPVPNSGFLITRDITAVPGAANQWTVDITKRPASTSIDGMTVSPGAGAPVQIVFNMTRAGAHFV
jgi:hypothetical protein